MFFFDYWTVFSTPIQFIHELAPRSLWLHPVDIGHKSFSFPRCWNGKWLVVQYLGCVLLGNLDLDFKIRISNLQKNAKSKNGFQRWEICSWISFLPFDWAIRKGIWNWLSLRTVVLYAHAQLAKKRPLFTRTVLQIPSVADFPIEQ